MKAADIMMTENTVHDKASIRKNRQLYRGEGASADGRGERCGAPTDAKPQTRDGKEQEDGIAANIIHSAVKLCLKNDLKR